MMKTDGSYRSVHLAWVTLLPCFPHLMVSSLMRFRFSSQHFGMILCRSALLPSVFPSYSRRFRFVVAQDLETSDLSHPQRRKKRSLLRTVDQGGILLWTSKKNNVKQVFLQS